MSTSSGDTERSATVTERVRDRERALGATLFRLVGVFEGSIAGGGVGALSENAFSYTTLELLIISGRLAYLQKNDLGPSG
jgi:hypothetical protein